MKVINLISLVIPCYNEAETIDEFYRRANTLTVSIEPAKLEFIFVNDGSTDDTGAILKKISAKDSRVKVLQLAQNRGHQIALSAGIDYATGDMIVTIDADLQDPPELVSEMLDLIEEGYDVVHAQRQKRDGETWFKLTTARLFYRFIRFASDTNIIENCGDFRAFTRSVQYIITSSRTPHKFLRGAFVQVGFRQTILSYNRDSRFAGETKYPFLKMLNLSVDALLGFSAVPIRIISYMSIFLWALSLIYLAKSLIEHYIFAITVPGWTSIIILVIFFTGLILFSIAIIGAYVGRIFEQGQNRPLYWLSNTQNIDFNMMEPNTEEFQEVKLAKHCSETWRR